MDTLEEVIFNRQFVSIYFLVSFFSFFLLFIEYHEGRRTNKIQNILLFVFCLIFVILFGTRNFEVGVDTKNYVDFFINATTTFFPDIGFGLLNLLLTDLIEVRTFMILISFIYLFTLYFAIHRLVKSNKLFFFFCLISLFFFKSMGINTIRQGMAASIFILGLSFNNNKIIKWCLYIICASLHMSMLIPILIFELTYFFKSVKIPFGILIFGIILSVLRFDIYGLLSNIPVVAILDKIDQYSNVDKSDYKIGFRADFFIFNMLFMLIGYKILLKLKEADVYMRYYISYIILSAYFFIMFNTGYSDRYGFLSWIFIPFLIKPVVEKSIKDKWVNLPNISILFFFIAIIFYVVK